MPKREDDFAPETIRRLAARVNYKCSKPDCRAPTSGPHTESTKSVNVGNAAHITAASPNGARYDANLTSEERKHINNGIWLCATHATQVDRDEIRFTVALLQKWKRDAEAEAEEALGKPQIQGKLPDLGAIISSQQETISSQQETIHKLTVNLSTALNDSLVPDSKWRLELKRALEWSESGVIHKVQAVQEIVAEIRQDVDFSKASSSFQSRLATAAAVCAVNMGDKDTADKEVQEAFRLAPENIEYISNMAAIAIMRNEYERAATLAEQVRAKVPQNENAALVLIQSWHYTNKPERVEEFLKANSWLLELPNGCAVIAQIHSNDNRFQEAIHFAKLALKKDKNHLQALEVLYDATFTPLREGIRNSKKWDYSLRTKRKLQRAEAAINRAITILEKSPDKERLHRAFSNRAAVRSAQEKTELAFSDLDRILRENPSDDNRDTANLNKGMILIHIGRAPEAPPFLQELITERWKKEGKFPLAYSYYVLGQEDKAVEIWESLWKPEICDAQQTMTASLLLSAYRRMNNNAGADSVLNRVKQFHPEHYEVQYLEAQDKYGRGDVEGAIDILQSAAAFCRANDDDAGCIKILMGMGDIFYRSNKVKEAAAVWKELSWERLLPPHRDAFVNALYESGQISEALQVAQSIRQQLGIVPRVAEIEALIDCYRSSPQTACEIWKKLALLEPRNYLHNINRAHAALMAEDKLEVQQALEGVSFENIKNDADSLRRVSNLLKFIGHKEAIRYAFRARHIDFGNPDSHHNYVQVFLDSTDFHSRDEHGMVDNLRASHVLGLNAPAWGEVPCTIRLLPLGETDERNYKAFTILNEPPFDISRGIYSANHHLAKRLLAIRDSQEVVSFQDSPTAEKQEYHIAEVLSPYVHAFQESLLRTQEWFGEEARVWSIDVRDGLDEFWKFMDVLGNEFNELMSDYKDWRIPLQMIAANSGRSLLDLWFSVSRQPHVGIHAEHGNINLFEQSLKTLEEKGDKPTLALDSTALIAITHFELPISKSHFRLLIPQSLHKSLRQLSTQPIAADIPAGLPAKQLEFVDKNVKVLPANAIIQFLPEDINLWQQVLGQEELDSALLAFEHEALLYSDDVLMRDAVKFHPGVGSTSTHIILEYLHRGNILGREEYYSLLEKLALANYRYLVLSTDFFLWLLKKYNFSVNTSIRSGLKFLEGPRCDDEAAIRISAALVASIWKEQIVPKGCFNILEEILLALSTGRHVVATLWAFCHLLAHPQSGIERKHLYQILWYVVSWKRRLFD